jgi:hypothetical protein
MTVAVGSKRLDPEVFELPVDKMREGYYSDAYFNHSRSALLAAGRHPRVLMQVFQKKRALLGGMDEAVAILKLCSHGWDELVVHALHDGDWIEPWETVLTIEGDYTLFAHLETVYLGVLARRTVVATNVARVLEAANGKPVIFMPARHDHHRVQTGDGYAAYVAGQVLGTPVGVTSDAQASWWGGRGVRGMSLRAGDEVIAAMVAQEDADLLVVTEQGFGKRTPVRDYPRKGRGGLGVKTVQLTEARGQLAGARLVREGYQVMLISTGGTVIRMPVEGIRRAGRATQGVIVMRLRGDEERVSALAPVVGTDPEDAEEPEIAPEPEPVAPTE